MLLVVTRGSPVRPSDEHSFMSPFILGNLVDDTDIATHRRSALRIRIAVSDVLNNHVTDFCGAFFSDAARPHNYIIPKGSGEVKNYFR